MPDYKITDHNTGKTYIARGASSMEEAQANFNAKMGYDKPEHTDFGKAYADMPQLLPHPQALPGQTTIMAGMATPFNMIARHLRGQDTGESWGESISNAYNAEKARQDEMKAIDREKWGVGQDVADVVGSLGLGAAGKGAEVAAEASKFIPGMLKAAGGGAGIGAAYGAGEGHSLQERANNAIKGGLFGGAVGAGGHVLTEGAMGAAGKVRDWYRTLTNPKQQARAQLTRDIAADVPTKTKPQAGLSEEEAKWATDHGYNIGNVDMGGPKITNTADALYQRHPELFDEFVAGRNSQMFPILEDSIKGMRDSQNEILRRQGKVASGQARAGKFYDAADLAADKRGVNLWDRDFRSMAGSDIFDEAMRKAGSISRDEAAISGVGTVVRNPFQWVNNGDGTFRRIFNPKLRELGMKPSLRFWDATKKGLDEIINEGTDVSGRMSPRASRALKLKNRLVTKLDKEVPEYAKARAEASIYLGEENASKAGEKLYRQSKGTAKSWDEIDLQMKRWSPGEKAEAAQGYLAAMQSDLGGVARGENSGHVDLSLRFLQSHRQQRIAKSLLGEDNFNELMAHKMVQRVVEYRNKAMTGNSKTWKRFVADTAVGGTIGSAGLGYLEGGDPTAITVGMIVGGLARHGPRFVDARMRERLAPYLSKEITSLDPAAYKMVIDTIAKNKKLMGRLKILTHPMRMTAARQPQWSSSD